MTLRFKQCDSKDIDLLTKIGRETFIVAFEHMNDPEDFKAYIEQAFSENQLQKELQTEGSEFYFVYKEGDLVAYIKLNCGDAQTEALGDKAIELERIYVQENFQNQGLGKDIMKEVIEQNRNKSFDFMWLGVWQKNEGAIRFYQKLGFEIFDTHPYYIGKDKQTDWLMRLELH